jgi:hypothetical protein
MTERHYRSVFASFAFVFADFQSAAIIFVSAIISLPPR